MMDAKFVKKCSVISFVLILVYIVMVFFNPSYSEFIQEIAHDLGIFKLIFKDAVENPYMDGHMVYTVNGYLPHNSVLVLACLIPAMSLLLYARQEGDVKLRRLSIVSVVAGWAGVLASAIECFCFIGYDFFDKYLLYKYAHTFSFTWEVDPSTGIKYGNYEYSQVYGEKLLSLGKIRTTILWTCCITLCVVAVVLLTAFIISVSRSANKRLQYKAELAKPIVAVLVLIPELLSLAISAMNKILQDKLDFLSLYEYVRTAQSVQFWLMLLIAVISAVLIFALGIRYGKKKPAEETVPKSAAEEAVQDPPANADELSFRFQK